jgi:hypothetical protein
MAYYWLGGGGRRSTSAGRLGGLRILRCMTGLETMCGDDFCSCTYLDLEKMKRPFKH